jgi:serine/threonine-protein kinase
MATVFLAEDLKHHRRVALKVLHPEIAATVGPDRFLREIETVAGLTHPHILPLHDSGEAEGLLYYVMPYVEGETLRERLVRAKQLPVDQAVRIAREVAGALEHAHRHGVVHRDIKPGNILLEEGHAVVADFGVARAVRDAGGEKMTATGLAVGTPVYMSPEQASGAEVDERSDLYALGCVLYEMLAGEPPLLGSTPQSTAAKRLTDRPTPLTALRDNVPTDLADVVEKALSRSPVDRYATAQEFSGALGRVPPGGQSEGVGSRGPRRRSRFVIATISGVAVAVLALVIGLGTLSHEAGHPRTAIAVLPFENLSPEGSNAYFAGGLHDELLTQLCKIASLTVISRTSVRPYAETEMPLQEIAEELGVGSIVEGTVQVVDDRLRVHVQLIDAATDAHLWAETYDRTLDDAFAIQSDIAGSVVSAVGGTLAASERQAMASAPTQNHEAYQLYLQARDYQHRPSARKQELSSAEQLFERALALDPDFALAHAALSELYGAMFWLKVDPAPERAEAQLREAEIALRLEPDLPEAHFAMGFCHYVRLDWRRALEEYQIAERDMPNDAHLVERIGYVHRRMGNWDQVFEAFEKATRLDPRDADLYTDLGGISYHLVRRYEDAIRAYDRALTLAPDNHQAAHLRAWAYTSLTGRRDTFDAVLERLPKSSEWWYRGTLTRLFWERKADSLIHVVRMGQFPVNALDDRFEPAALTVAHAQLLKGDTAAAHLAFDSALVILDSVIVELPDDWRVHASRGKALAGLGRRAEAIEEAQWLRDCPKYSDDAMHGPDLAVDRAMILAAVGEKDAALDEIERQLAGPSWLGGYDLASPTWDALRNHPRFQTLGNKYR